MKEIPHHDACSFFLEKLELEQKALLGDEEPRRQKLLQPHAARLAERSLFRIPAKVLINTNQMQIE